jgi:hypothetical protein
VMHYFDGKKSLFEMTVDPDHICRLFILVVGIIDDLPF